MFIKILFDILLWFSCLSSNSVLIKNVDGLLSFVHWTVEVITRVQTVEHPCSWSCIPWKHPVSVSAEFHIILIHTLYDNVDDNYFTFQSVFSCETCSVMLNKYKFQNIKHMHYEYKTPKTTHVHTIILKHPTEQWRWRKILNKHTFTKSY